MILIWMNCFPKPGKPRILPMRPIPIAGSGKDKVKITLGILYLYNSLYELGNS